MADLSLTLGCILIGTFFTVFLFGVTWMQTITYFTHFPNDAFLVKFTVSFLWLLHLVYTACICQGAWTISVADSGQTLLPWGLNLAILIGPLIGHGVQAFFVARIYKVTGALSLLIFLGLVIACLEGFSLTVSAKAFRSDFISVVAVKWKWILTLLLFGDAGLDIVNACVLCFYLKVQRRTAFSRSTAVLLDRLVVYALQTGLAMSMIALAAAISFKVAPGYIWTMFFLAIPGSFMSTLLANINSRKGLSQAISGATSSENTNYGLSQIQFSRNIAISCDATDSGPIELTKVSARNGLSPV
ncbi:hypothetical protein DFH06DRAFT_1225191 [Mycena polygramma]|nr:hypothetical protein DFH06DRAFT_1225191 [Mycena polygramma]